MDTDFLHLSPDVMDMALARLMEMNTVDLLSIYQDDIDANRPSDFQDNFPSLSCITDEELQEVQKLSTIKDFDVIAYLNNNEKPNSPARKVQSSGKGISMHAPPPKNNMIDEFSDSDEESVISIDGETPLDLLCKLELQSRKKNEDNVSENSQTPKVKVKERERITKKKCKSKTELPKIPTVKVPKNPVDEKRVPIVDTQSQKQDIPTTSKSARKDSKQNNKTATSKARVHKRSEVKPQETSKEPPKKSSSPSSEHKNEPKIENSQLEGRKEEKPVSSMVKSDKPRCAKLIPIPLFLSPVKEKTKHSQAKNKTKPKFKTVYNMMMLPKYIVDKVDELKEGPLKKMKKTAQIEKIDKPAAANISPNLDHTYASVPKVQDTAAALMNIPIKPQQPMQIVNGQRMVSVLKANSMQQLPARRCLSYEEYKIRRSHQPSVSSTGSSPKSDTELPQPAKRNRKRTSSTESIVYSFCSSSSEDPPLRNLAAKRNTKRTSSNESIVDWLCSTSSEGPPLKKSTAAVVPPQTGRSSYYRTYTPKPYTPDDDRQAQLERRVVHVGQLPKMVTIDRLYDEFRCFGVIRHIYLCHKQANICAFITFTNIDSADRAIKAEARFPEYSLGYGGRGVFTDYQPYVDFDKERNEAHPSRGKESSSTYEDLLRSYTKIRNKKCRT